LRKDADCSSELDYIEQIKIKTAAFSDKKYADVV
jgi:hypothetical protein